MTRLYSSVWFVFKCPFESLEYITKGNWKDDDHIIMSNILLGDTVSII